MAGKQWMPEQLDAIRGRGGDILVSAAAGSGKTSVLVERIITQIVDPAHPTPADRFLVATFSNAAASEMRERIEERLGELIASDPGNMALRRQKILLGKASIGTVHSFCMRLVREYFHQLDIAPDFRIGDESELNVIKAQSIEEALEDFYGSGDQDFYALVELLSGGRDDRKLVQTAFNLYEFIRSHPFPKAWMDEKLAMYDPEIPIGSSPWGEVILAYAADALCHCGQICSQALRIIQSDDKMAEAYEAQFAQVLHQLEEMRRAVMEGDWDGAKAAIGGFVFPRLNALRGYKDSPQKRQVQGIQSNIKDIVKGLNTKQFIATAAQCRDDIIYLRPKIEALFALTQYFSERYQAHKTERNLVDFSDLEHLTLALMVNRDNRGVAVPTKIAGEVAGRFDAVLVDEYQDTNEVQDLIFRTVSQNKANLFMVGDVKQSIYRFRQAMPEIFIRRRQQAQPFDGEHFPANIMLGKNFRSRKHICAGINAIFGKLMSPEVGGVSYPEEALTPGADYPEQTGPSVHVMMVDASADEGTQACAQEAARIAEKINQMVEDELPVTDPDHGQLRPCTYRDFCILLRAKTHTAVFERELAARSVPVWSDFSKKFFTSKEVLYIVSLLQAVDNPLLDIEMTAAMMSPMFAFTADEMAVLHIRYGGGVYLAAGKAAEEGDQKCKAFLDTLGELRAFAVTSTVDLLIQKIFEITGIDLVAAAMQGGEQRAANLNMLVKQARDYEAGGYRGLSGFNRLMSRLMEGNQDVSRDLSLPDSENVVKIMTMHRSKGLEFPICFVADCSKRFNTQDLNGATLLHSGLGFSCKYRDLETLQQYSTIPHEALKLEVKREALSEEMRILYVALTRAKEHLFISVAEKNIQRKLSEAAGMVSPSLPAAPFMVQGARSYSDWIFLAVVHHPACNGLREACGLPEVTVINDSSMEVFIASPINNFANAEEPQGLVSKPDKELLYRLRERSSFTYPDQPLTQTPTKLAVSDLAKQDGGGPAVLKRPKFMYEKGLSPVERGNAHHKFMQFADYGKARDNPQNEVARLVGLEHLTREEGDAIRIDNLRRFFHGELAGRIFQSPRVLRELKFIVAYGEECQGQQTMVQGVADCVFYEDDQLVIVDYKTDYVESAGELVARYGIQLSIYEKALAESLGVSIKELVIYSFSLGEAIDLKHYL